MDENQRAFEELPLPLGWEDDADDETRHPLDTQGYLPQMPEMTADLVSTGRFDIQGIHWDDLPVTREEFRQRRVQGYTNYRNHEELTLDTISHEIAKPTHVDSFYAYQYTSFQQRCSIAHFQLRHLMAATSKNDIYFMSGSSVKRWCPMTKTSSDVLNCPTAYFDMKVSTMTANDDLLIVGGFDGEYVIQRLSDSSEPRVGKITHNPNGITNHCDLVENRAGVKTCIISSNDDKIRIMEMNRLQIVNQFDMAAAVNCTASSPDQRLLLAVGDHRESYILDSQSGQKIHEVTGHLDFSFSCSWSACGNFIATGNQDTTARVYDVRNLSKSLAVLPGNLGAIRSLRFSPDGAFLFMAEPADFVHIVDMKSLPGYEDTDSSSEGPRTQVIDFFGEIAGIAVSPVIHDFLFIGNADDTYGCLLEYQRLRTRLPSLDDF